MFDIGFPEMLLIGLVAVLVFGPDRLPEFVRTAGRLLRQVRTMVGNAQQDLRKELGPEFADLDVRELDPHSFIRKHLLAAEGDEPAAADLKAKAPVGPTPYDHEAT